MAKGDHERGERRIDEQMKQSQSYLTMLQQQMANQNSGFSNAYFGSGGLPQQGNIYGWGSTVPHYSPYGPIFSGNGTDTPVTGSYSPGGYQTSGERAVPRGIPPGEGQYQQMPQAGSGMSEDAVRNRLMPILRAYGGASSESLTRALPEIQRMFPGARFDTSSGPVDEVIIPGFGGVDLISNAEGGGAKEWTFQTGPSRGGGSAPGYPTAAGAMQGGGGVFGSDMANYGDIYGRYSEFADTGGFSEQDKANIRSRAVSPIRSIYSSARQGLDRQRSLQGGYSPGYATALGRFSREQGQLASDATTNAEAAIAEMVQRGRLAGMGGMSSIYGTTPGRSNMVGNQMLQSMGQQLTGAGLQNQLSLGQIGAQQNLASVPGNFDTTLGTIGRIGGIAGQIGGAIYPWLGAGSATNSLGVTGDYRVPQLPGRA